MKVLKVLFLFLVVLTQKGMAQEALGLRLQQFSGINSTMLNPALGGLYPKKWDINLVETVNSISNNYAFFENSKAGEFNRYRSIQNLYNGPDLGNDLNPGTNSLVVDYYTRKNSFYGDVSATVLGPSFLLRFGQHGIGLTTRLRLETETTFPADLGYYTYNANRGKVNMTPSHFSSMAWREWGLHYDYAISSGDDRSLILGVNLRYLQGYEALSVFNKTFRYQQIRPDSFEVSPGEATLMFTTGNLGANANTPYEAKIQGSGLGLDIGAIYSYRGERWNCNVGVSLNDLGNIVFRNSGQMHRFSNDSTLIFNTAPYTSWTDAADITNKAANLSELLSGDPRSSLVDSSFSMGLPGHLVVHGGLYKDAGWRMFFVVQQSLPLKGNQLHKASFASIVPGWENNWIGAYAPVTLYNFQRLRVGTAVRLAFLTIGTDNLIPWMVRGKLSEAGFYTAIKISPWPKNMSTGDNAKGGKGKRGKGLDCYSF